MRDVPFRTILEDVLGLAGYPYDTATQSQLDQAARFINRNLRYAWEWGPWPEWTRAERRPFASEYNATIQYGIGEVVYYGTTDKYYQCTVVSQGNLPTDTNYWSEYTDYDKEVRFEQTYARKLGRVWTVTKHNPYVKFRGDNLTYPHMLSSLGVFVPGANVTRVWVLFSDRSPEFSASIWSASNTYSDGDVVYYPGTEDGNFPNKGECYKAEYDSTGAEVWSQVQFPMALRGYVVNKSAADLLRYYKEHERATLFDGMAKSDLLEEYDKVNTEGFQKVVSAYIEVGV